MPKQTKTKNTDQNNKVSVNKLMALLTIVDRSKADFYIDVIQSFEVNFQTSILCEGTAKKEILEYLGLDNCEKTLIISVIKENNVKKALSTLQEKFESVKNGNGIAFTIPFTSVIGKSVFAFLTNNAKI